MNLNSKDILIAEYKAALLAERKRNQLAMALTNIKEQAQKQANITTSGAYHTILTQVHGMKEDEIDAVRRETLDGLELDYHRDTIDVHVTDGKVTDGPDFIRVYCGYTGSLVRDIVFHAVGIMLSLPNHDNSIPDPLPEHPDGHVGHVGDLTEQVLKAATFMVAQYNHPHGIELDHYLTWDEYAHGLLWNIKEHGKFKLGNPIESYAVKQ